MSRPGIQRMSSVEVDDKRTNQQREAEVALMKAQKTNQPREAEVALMDAIQSAQLLRKAEEQTKQANRALRALQRQQDAAADALALHTVEMSDGEFEEAMRQLEGRGKIQPLPGVLLEHADACSADPDMDLDLDARNADMDPDIPWTQTHGPDILHMDQT